MTVQADGNNPWGTELFGFKILIYNLKLPFGLSALSIQTAGSILTNDPLAERGGHGGCT